LVPVGMMKGKMMEEAVKGGLGDKHRVDPA
jgi:hypothetical protein